MMKTKSLTFIVLFTMIFLSHPIVGSSAEQKFPSKPVNLWVGFPPGGSADILARALAEASEKNLGQKIVVTNKAGGGGTVASSLLKNEKPDGYTLLLTTDTPVTRAPHMSDLEYDPFKDLDTLMVIGKWKTVWTVRSDSPFKTWKDLVDWAKANKGQLTFGHCTASSFYFGMVKIAKIEGFTFKGIPYACDGPTMTAVLGGHVMVGGGTAAPYRSHVLAGNVRIILSDEKIDYVKEAQTTFKEAGYSFEVPLLAIILSPKGIPEHVKKTLENAFLNGMKSELFKRVSEEQELKVAPLLGDKALDYLKKVSQTYEELVRDAGMHKTQKKQ